MAATATTPTDGSEVHEGGIGIDHYRFTATTGANGEDGISIETGFREIKGIQVNGLAAGKSGPFYGVVNGTKAEIYALAGAPGDAALVSVHVWGLRG
ncbi:MAG: hypothetical protein AMS14_10850 [Planctomycetes bacterium DG_20]|nr:MAG: hypothetical protein AMS14_10850 [Planctomycetes bacterium DG_20]